MYFNLKIGSPETKPLMYTYAIMKWAFCYCIGIRPYIGPVYHIKRLYLFRLKKEQQIYLLQTLASIDQTMIRFAPSGSFNMKKAEYRLLLLVVLSAAI